MKTVLYPHLYDELKKKGFPLDGYIRSEVMPLNYNPRPTATTEGVRKVLQSLWS